HLGGRGRRLSREEPVRAEDQEGKRHAAPRARGEPGHPRLGGGAAPAAVLRRLRRRKREPGPERKSEAREEEAAVDRRQHRAGHDGERRERDHALRRERRASARPRAETRARAQAGRARRWLTDKEMRNLEVKILDERMRGMLPHYASAGAAGLDLRACIDAPVTLQPGDSRLISSGIAIHVGDPGYAAIILPRSG